MIEIVDLSQEIFTGMPVFPGLPEVKITVHQSHEQLDGITDSDVVSPTVNRLELGEHTGTHVDAPLHFLAEGATADALPLDALVGPAEVVEVAADGDVDEEVVGRVPDGAERVLFKTRNSGFWRDDEFRRDFARVTPEAAAALVRRAMRLVGVDYLSVGGHETHRTLLGAGVVVGAHAAGSLSPAFPILGACLSFLTRMVGVRYGIDAPTAPSRRRPPSD